jgi:DNA-directed RNA polymerase I, II, and III subunit RPABC1
MVCATMELYLQRLPRVIEHICLLLEDRGYTLPQYAEHGVKPESLLQTCMFSDKSIGENLSCSVRHKTTGSNLYVCFLDPIFDFSKGGKEVMTSSYQLHNAVEQVKKNELCIVISYSKLSPDASREAQKLKKKLQIFTFKNLAFPLSRHVLVPRHVALSTEEALEFEASRKIERHKLPHLKLHDPVRIWYGWSKYTIVRIERPTGPVWRCVR